MAPQIPKFQIRFCKVWLILQRDSAVYNNWHLLSTFTKFSVASFVNCLIFNNPIQKLCRKILMHVQVPTINLQIAEVILNDWINEKKCNENELISSSKMYWFASLAASAVETTEALIHETHLNHESDPFAQAVGSNLHSASRSIYSNIWSNKFCPRDMLTTEIIKGRSKIS